MDSQPFDLVLKGGHVIDPANGIDGRRDVAVRGDRIAEVGEGIDPALAAKVVDVTGKFVTPGLIDLHTHSFGYVAWTFPDEYALPNGITTVVDAGGAGWKNFDEFKRSIIDRSQTRVVALLNIVGGGMLGTVEQDVTEMQPEPCAEVVREHKEVIVGIKAAHHDGPGWQSVDGAVRAAEATGTFAMIDYHRHAKRTYRELILEHMRPGDVHTHMYGLHTPQFDDRGKIHGFMQEARKRGVKFDVGHGGGSFWFRIAKPCMDQGWHPDTISTDIHKGSFFLPRATMPMTMSKLMNLGMSLQNAVDRSTRLPAQTINRPELGTLTVGRDADIAVFELERGDFGFVDSGLARMNGSQRLLCHLTLRAGKALWDLNGLTRPAWESSGEYIRLPV
jgi:dihydroorotase